MTIPDFQTLMLPILIATDGKERVALRDLVNQLSDEFELTEEERLITIPSGPQPLMYNRVAWSVTHLAKAQLLERPARGQIRITPRGKTAIESGRARIDMRYLAEFPEYKDFRERGASEADGTPTPIVEPTETPDVLLGQSYQRIRQNLADYLLDRVKGASPKFFESLVVSLLVRMGYGGSLVDAGKAVGRSGDGGIDGIIKEDKLGLDFVYIQAKRWSGPVGRPEVQSFAGSLDGHRARKGVMITTSNFISDAHDYVGRIEKRIVLIEGPELAQLMMDHGVGVTDVATYTVQRVDLDYFDEEI